MSTPSTQLQLSAEPFRMEQVLRLAPSGPQLGLVIALAAATTLAVGVVMWAARPSMVPLDMTMPGGSRLEVIQYLESQGHRYEMSDGMILVPQELREQLKATLSMRGISLDDGAAAETGDSAVGSMTTSEEQIRLHQVRELELSLAKTIRGIRGVSAAKVHLAVPKRSVFVGGRRTEPSASVQLKMLPGRVLDAAQVAGIVNLVANGVPQLTAARVSVSDGRGKQLNQDDAVSGEREKDLSYKQHYEELILAKVTRFLDVAVGEGSYQASVEAQLDFSRVAEDQETYDEKRTAIVSAQEERRGPSDFTDGFGVPGAPSNEPPEGGSLQPQDLRGSAQNVPDNAYVKKTRNTVPSKVTRQTRMPSWRLERLGLAVLIDDKKKVDEAGEVTRTPWEQVELDKIGEVLKTTIGFDAERGDSVSVVNQSMVTPAPIAEQPAPKPWEQPWFEQVVKSAMAGLALLLLVLMVIRPTARALIGKNAAARGASGAGDGDGGGEADEPAAPRLEADRLSLSADAGEMLPAPARVHGDILNLAREMAAQDPKRVATVLKKWMEADE